MAQQINILYSSHHVASSVIYENNGKRVFMSRTRKPEMPNVLICEHCQHPSDSFLMTEPVVVHAGHYDMNFLSKFHKIFGCFNQFATPLQDKFVFVNYGSEIGKPNAENLKQNWLPWEQRINGAIIVASGHKQSNNPASIYDLRLMLADFFYENGYAISWYGYNNINRPYYKGFLSDFGPIEKVYDPKDKIKEICKYRFNICTENTYDRIYSTNYLTEKLPHAIYGGAIPLYMGCYNIEQLAPVNTYFDLRNFVIKQNNQLRLLKEPLLEAIKGLSENDFIKYNNAQYQYINDPNGICLHTDLSRVYDIMLDVL